MARVVVWRRDSRHGCPPCTVVVFGKLTKNFGWTPCSFSYVTHYRCDSRTPGSLEFTASTWPNSDACNSLQVKRSAEGLSLSRIGRTSLSQMRWMYGLFTYMKCEKWPHEQGEMAGQIFPQLLQWARPNWKKLWEQWLSKALKTWQILLAFASQTARGVARTVWLTLLQMNAKHSKLVPPEMHQRLMLRLLLQCSLMLASPVTIFDGTNHGLSQSGHATSLTGSDSTGWGSDHCWWLLILAHFYWYFSVPEEL